jgi:hypothetical protein
VRLSGEVRREELSFDLGRRHPSCGLGDLRAESATPADLCCEITSLAPGQENPMDLAVEPLRFEPDAGQGNDRPGRRWCGLDVD